MHSVPSLAAHGLMLVLQLSLPPIIVASLVGIIFSLFQAITQLQEQTLSFGVKLIAVSITLFLMSDWICGVIISYTKIILDSFQLY